MAGRLSDHLALRFGRGNVFIDIASIPAGVDFGEVVRRALDKCGVLLAVIGPRWLSSASGSGRRLDDPDDWVVCEVGTALARGIRVVPVLVDGAGMPSVADLPEALAPLAQRNAVRINYATFAADVAALSDALTPNVDAQEGLYVARVDQLTNPLRVGVHPAAMAEADDGSRNRIPPFVERDVLADLRAALTTDNFVLIVGDSTAGKTRLAFEAMRAFLPSHCCVVPEWPDALADAVMEARARRPSVLWLDDLERYLSGKVLKTARLHKLLDVDGVIVLATMRAHEHANYSPRNDHLTDGQTPRMSRQIMEQATEIRLERMWSVNERASAAAMSDDWRIEQALASADNYGLAEFMASGPQLLKELHDAWSATPARRKGGRSVVGDPRGAALVTAAIDVRLTGYHRPVSLAFLRDLHKAYLAARGGPMLRPGSWKNAVAWATQPIHATSSLLEPAEDDCWLAFDYLVDAAANDPAAPPILDEIWTAVIDHATLAEAVDVAWQASYANRPEYARSVAERALADDEYMLAAEVAGCLSNAGQEQAAVELLQAAVARAETSGRVAREDLLALRQALAWEVGEKQAGHGDPARALKILRSVVDDASKWFGDTDPRTLSAQLGLARQLGAVRAWADALAVAREVAERATVVLGKDHEIVDSARFETAVWTGRLEGPEERARVLDELYSDLRERPSVDLLMLLDVVWNLGGALLAAGNSDEALSLLEMVVEDASNAFGDSYARTLDYRLTHLSAVAATSELGTTVELAEDLVQDCRRVLGDNHLTTLQARYQSAALTAETDDVAGARLFEELHDDAVRFLGADHWLVEDVRDRRPSLPGG